MVGLQSEAKQPIFNCVTLTIAMPKPEVGGCEIYSEYSAMIKE